MSHFDDMVDLMRRVAKEICANGVKAYEEQYINLLRRATHLNDLEIITMLIVKLEKRHEELKMVTEWASKTMEEERQRVLEWEHKYYNQAKKTRELEKELEIYKRFNHALPKGRIAVEKVKQGIPIAKKDVDYFDVWYLEKQGLTHEEIARKLNVSRSTVERRLKEQREVMKQKILKEDEQES